MLKPACRRELVGSALLHHLDYRCACTPDTCLLSAVNQVVYTVICVLVPCPAAVPQLQASECCSPALEADDLQVPQHNH